MNQSRLTPISECGLLIAISILLGAISMYLPILGTIVEFFWTFPLLVIVVRHGISRGLISWFAVTILFSLFVGPLTAVRMSISYGAASIALGFGIVKGFRPTISIAISMIAGFAAQILTVAILFFFLDINIITMQLKLVQESFDQTFAMYESLGVDPKTISEAKSQINPALEIVAVIMPLIFTFVAAINTLISYKAIKWIFPKIGLGSKIIDLPAFKDWRFPSACLYLLAFSLIGLYWGTTRQILPLYQVSLNVNILTMFIGLFQGMSVVAFFMDWKNISKTIRNIFFIIMFFQLILMEIVAFIGLFDMIFDYRRRFTEKFRK